MARDRYARPAGRYDLFVEPLVRWLRTIGLQMSPPHAGASVLDIGCGTGTHLRMYHEAGCRVFGIDLSPAMLKGAQAKLGGRAALHLGEGSRMPFADESFDLIVAMFLFHQVSVRLRAPIMGEAKRAMKRDGRFLIVDYHPGPIRFPEGWLSKAIITCMESLAGPGHFGNYRDFMASGGLTPLIVENRLVVHKKMVVDGGTIGLHLLHSSS